ncbi:MAG: Trk system potassium transporter TrkA [Alphaproteobacteria bacterium]|nr:Trk system potassium transporter TrkA [Alphaproteobacteria bacterium]
MKIIICGAGQVGASIAKQLADEHHDVTVIDISSELIKKLSNSLEVQGIVGHAAHPDVLEAAGAGGADMLIAATYSDEVNMVACQVAHSLFSVPTKVARVRTQCYLAKDWRGLFSPDHLPIDLIISPELEVARAIRRRVDTPGAFEVVPFAEDRIHMMGIALTEDCPIIDTPLSQLTELFPDLHVRVVGIRRKEKTIVPSASDQLLAGDQVYVVTEKAQRRRVLAVYGHEEPEARRIIIIGGGNVGLYLARELEDGDVPVNVKIIEESEARARFIADELSRCVVLHGDALDHDLLREANVDMADIAIAVANDDEVNILSSLLAKREGAKRAVTLVNNPVYGPLMTSLGVDVYIDPRATTVSTILRHVRRGRIRGLHTLSNAGAELIEAEALETLDLLNKPLRDLKVPSGVRFGAIVRGEDVIIPRGDSVIRAGDRVIIFALAEQIKKVEQMFSVQLGYF